MIFSLETKCLHTCDAFRRKGDSKAGSSSDFAGNGGWRRCFFVFCLLLDCNGNDTRGTEETLHVEHEENLLFSVIFFSSYHDRETFSRMTRHNSKATLSPSTTLWVRLSEFTDSYLSKLYHIPTVLLGEVSCLENGSDDPSEEGKAISTSQSIVRLSTYFHYRSSRLAFIPISKSRRASIFSNPTICRSWRWTVSFYLHRLDVAGFPVSLLSL